MTTDDLRPEVDDPPEPQPQPPSGEQNRDYPNGDDTTDTDDQDGAVG